MTEKELQWRQQLRSVVQKLPDYVKLHGYRNDPVKYIATTLANEVKAAAAAGTATYSKNDIEWIIIELVEVGVLSADVNDATGAYNNIRVVENSAADVAKLKTQMTMLATQLSSFKQGIEAALAKEKEATERAILAEKRAAETKSQERIVEVQLKNGTKMVKKSTGLFHKEFERMLKLARSREEIFIYGPSGTGKTYVTKQLADVLKLPFGFVSCTAGMSEGQITGRLLPTGKGGQFEYVQSEFVHCYENGGIFLLDEMDACDPNILLVVNSALSNGRLSLVNRPAKPYAERHPDFICVGAANTVGTGGDRMYSGRNKLDLSTLERFAIGKVYMDYDPMLEATLCPDDDLRNLLLRYRRGINANRLERAMTTRFMEKAYNMVHNPDETCRFTIEDVNLAFFQGFREDEKNKVMYFKG